MGELPGVSLQHLQMMHLKVSNKSWSLAATLDLEDAYKRIDFAAVTAGL